MMIRNRAMDKKNAKNRLLGGRWSSLLCSSLLAPALFAGFFLSWAEAGASRRPPAPTTEEPKNGPDGDVKKRAPEVYPPKNPGPISERGIKIISRSRGVFVQTYQEKLGPLTDADIKQTRRVTDRALIASFKKQLSRNSTFQPKYRKRCLPVYDYGLQFREGKQTRTFRFSFRCNTMFLVEEKIFRDFTRERTDLYTLFKYEVNGKTSEIVPPKK